MKYWFLLFVLVPYSGASQQTGFNSSHYPKLLRYRDISGEEKVVSGLFEWELKRQQIKDSLQALFGKLPEIPTMPPFKDDSGEFPPFDVIIKDSLVTPHYTRYNIRFTVALDESVTAYFYLPKNRKPNEKRPAMLALHETDSAGKKSVDGEGSNSHSRVNLAYGRELAGRGYVVIAADYPGFGDQANYDFKSDRYESGIMKGIFNHIRCVDFLQSRKEVDPERIGIIGHSLGGHSAMYAAVFDARLKVIVSSCGWTLDAYYNNYNEEMRKKYGSRRWGRAQERYAPLAMKKYQLKTERFPYDSDDVIAALAPRYFFSNSPVHDANFNVEGVRKGIANASAVYRLFNAEENIQVRYPVAAHDFPSETREEAYRFIDRVLMHRPSIEKK